MVIATARDTVIGTEGSIIVTMNDGVSYTLAHVTNLEVDTDTGLLEMTFPGSTSKSYRPGIKEHSGSFTISYMTSLFRSKLDEAEREGKPFVFNIQVTNEDRTSKDTIGKQRIIFRDCQFSKYPQVRFGGGEILEETYEFKAESIVIENAFEIHPAMKIGT